MHTAQCPLLTLSVGTETQVKNFLDVIQSQAANEDKSQQGLYKMTKGECTSEQALFPVSQLWICTFPMHLGLHSFKSEIANHLYDLMIKDTYKHMKERWQKKGQRPFVRSLLLQNILLDEYPD